MIAEIRAHLSWYRPLKPSSGLTIVLEEAL